MCECKIGGFTLLPIPIMDLIHRAVYSRTVSREWPSTFSTGDRPRKIFRKRDACVFLAHTCRFIRPVGALNLCLVAFPRDYRSVHPFRVPGDVRVARGSMGVSVVEARRRPHIRDSYKNILTNLLTSRKIVCINYESDIVRLNFRVPLPLASRRKNLFAGFHACRNFRMKS